MNRKTSVVVTGGAGFIGSHIVDRLVALGHRVTVVDNLSCGKRSNVNPKATLVPWDIRNPNLKRVFLRVKPTVVFHLAAQKNVSASIEDPQFDAEVNVMGSLNVIEQSRRIGVRKFVFSSTGGALYGDGVKLPTPEMVAPRPISPYGIAKFAIGQYLAFYTAQFGMKTVSLQYANVYGPRQDPKGEAGVVAIFGSRLLKGLSLRVNGTGTQTRDYIYVDDVVRANIAAMRQDVSGEINIGTGIETSVNVLAKVIMRQAGIHTKVIHREAVAGEVRRSALSWQKAKQELRWSPKVPLATGIRRTLDWMRTEVAR